MKEYGYPFNGDMIRAYQRGDKTQTRRLDGLETINKCPDKWRYAGLAKGTELHQFIDREANFTGIAIQSSLQVGDLMVMRETFRYVDFCLLDVDKQAQRVKVRYKADLAEEWVKKDKDNKTRILIPGTWKPSIFMPYFAARYKPPVLEVRAQRLQDITEEDAIAEGMDTPIATYFGLSMADYSKDGGRYYRRIFQYLWDSIYGKKYPWTSNPWVFAYTIARFEAMR